MFISLISKQLQQVRNTFTNTHIDLIVPNTMVLNNFLLDYFSPKAEVTGSNPVGCANLSNGLSPPTQPQ